MVCALEEDLAFCVVQDANEVGLVRAKFHFPASATVADLYQEVARVIECHPDSFNLVLQGNQNEYAVSSRLLRLFIDSHSNRLYT